MQLDHGVGKISGQIAELDERFLEHRKQGKWLVEFYAPWCGHCKKLEPIFHQVSVSLRNTDIHVAKLDCTRYSHVASEFGVRGFPTIKFFQGDNIYTHRGERTGEDIIEFVNKAKGPPVRQLSSIGRFNEAKSIHSDGVFYMVVGEEDPSEDLYTKYSSIAEEQVSIAYFYAGTKRVLPQEVELKSYPTVLVFKDKTYYEYQAPKGVATMSSLQKWVNSERYPAFPLVTGSNINEMTDTGKLLVIFVIDLNDPAYKAENEKVKEIGRYLAMNERDTYHSAFQFLWMDDPETANNIMLTFINMPYLLVLDPLTHMFYIPDQSIDQLDLAAVKKFLNNVKSEKMEAYGGTGFFQRLKRLGYDILTTVVSVWQSSRWLFLLMFGLPTAVISIVCYSLCCMETVDDEIHSDDDSDEEERETLAQQIEQEMQPKDSGHEKAE